MMNSEKLVLEVDGMSCGNCVKHVTQALSAVPGVSGVKVDLKTKRAEVVRDPAKATTAALLAALDEAGYEGREA